MAEAADTFDFSQYSTVGKKELIKNLSQRQVDLAKMIADYHGGQNIDANGYLSFMILIKHSNFRNIFFEKIENRSMTQDDFANFFVQELDKYVNDNLTN